MITSWPRICRAQCKRSVTCIVAGTKKEEGSRIALYKPWSRLVWYQAVVIDRIGTWDGLQMRHLITVHVCASLGSFQKLSRGR
jgi:hypothetical protein